MKERLAFSIGTGVVLLGMSLVVNGVAQVQTGPGWEIPAAAATNSILFGFISVLLYGIGIICYFRRNRFTSLSPPSQKTFWILLGVGLLITVLSYVLDAGQWQFTHQNLSAVVQKRYDFSLATNAPFSEGCTK